MIIHRFIQLNEHLTLKFNLTDIELFFRKCHYATHEQILNTLSNSTVHICSCKFLVALPPKCNKIQATPITASTKKKKNTKADTQVTIRTVQLKSCPGIAKTLLMTIRTVQLKSCPGIAKTL
jgi:hypothetical protein